MFFTPIAEQTYRYLHKNSTHCRTFSRRCFLRMIKSSVLPTLVLFVFKDFINISSQSIWDHLDINLKHSVYRSQIVCEVIPSFYPWLVEFMLEYLTTNIFSASKIYVGLSDLTWRCKARSSNEHSLLFLTIVRQFLLVVLKEEPLLVASNQPPLLLSFATNITFIFFGPTNMMSSWHSSAQEIWWRHIHVKSKHAKWEFAYMSKLVAERRALLVFSYTNVVFQNTRLPFYKFLDGTVTWRSNNSLGAAKSRAAAATK